MSVLPWIHYTRDIPGAGLDVTREASTDELAALARDIDVVAVKSLLARYRIVASAGARFTLSGTLRAELSRECVVTLEPMDQTLSADLAAVFSEARGGTPPDEIEGSLADLDAPEEAPIENGSLDIGRVVFEELLSGLDPYPRKDGVEFAWEDKAAAASPANPFATLAQLKKTRENDNPE